MSDENLKENGQILDKLFYNSVHLPPKPVHCSKKPSKVQESPLDARSPQEVLQAYGMYKDQSYYEQHPDKIYMDLTQFDDYESLLNKKIDIERKFKQLPVDVRAQFNHDPSEFVSYVNSKDFKLETLLDDKTKKAYASYKADEERKAAFKAYQNSEEYKKLQQEALLRAQFEKEQFEQWKVQNNKTS